MRTSAALLILGFGLACAPEPPRELDASRGTPLPRTIARAPDIPVNPDDEVIGAQFGFPTSALIAPGLPSTGMIYTGGSRGLRGREGNPARVRAGNAEVEGPLSRDIVRRVVRQHFVDLRACYESALGEVPTLAGTIVLEFTVTPEGALDPLVIDDSALPQSKVGACFMAELVGWTMPRPDGGGTVNVRYPLRLEPPSGDFARDRG